MPEVTLAPERAAFFDYVRGRNDVTPAGYSEAGLRAYRHLVYLGASQAVDAEYPHLRGQLTAQAGESAWRTLIEDFVRQSTWESPFYADLPRAFLSHLARQRDEAPDPRAA